MEISNKAFVSLLKDCARKKDIQKGIQIHGDITQKGLLAKSPFLVSALITMYAKCGMIKRAKNLYDDFRGQNIVIWNSLITGYVEHGQVHETLKCFESMHKEGVCPDSVTFICMLKVAGNIGCMEKGMQIHAEIVYRGIFEENNMCLATALVDMYAKCGMLVEAHQLHDMVRVRDVISWSALISGYAQHGQPQEALNCYEEMYSEGLSPNAITFISILKACGSIGAIEKGIHVHCEIVRKMFLEKNIVLGNALVGMYAKCGILEKARQVHSELFVRDGISWSSLITGYAQHEQGHEALNCFERMQGESMSPDGVIIIGILNACGAIGAINKGKQIHCRIIDRGMLEKDIVLGTSLVDMYIKCNMLVEAQQVHDELHVRNVVSWNALIVGYAQRGQGSQALECLEQMQIEGLPPDPVTFVGILKACGSIGAIEKGEQFHDMMDRNNWLKKDIVLCTTLVDMYAKCGMLAKAQEVLDELAVRNVVTWSAMIAGYAVQGQLNEALKCFKQMQSEGLSPNEITFACMLKACGNVGAIGNGIEIHDEILRRGLLKHNVVLGNALIDMYTTCGVVMKAREVHNELVLRDVVSWSALIAGYTQQGHAHEAINCFEQMQGECICPNAVTFLSILKACGSIGAIDKGKEIHNLISNKGLLKKDVMLGTAVVDMYAKCGVLEKAHQVLEGLPIRNVFSWSALIAGYAQQGQGHKAMRCFEHMQGEGLFPDEVTFLCVLNACTHSGLLDDAQTYFQSMSKYYGITPSLEHHTCMAVSLGCIGHFDKVISMIKTMPSSSYLPVWRALLSACQRWGNVKLGSLAFDQAMQLDDSSSSSYILMANLYAASGMQEDAESIEAMRRKMMVGRI